jgi:hypothetical protein
VQQLGQRHRLLHRLAHDHAAAGQDHREFRRREQLRRLVERRLLARAQPMRIGFGISHSMSP